MTTASPKTSLSKSLHFLFGAGLLVSFFLPWVAWKDIKVSGYHMPAGNFFKLSESNFGLGNPFPQFDFTFYFFWLIPVLVVAGIVIVLQNKKTSIPAFISGALALSLVTVYYFFSNTLVYLGVGNSAFDMLEPGAFITVFTAIGFVLTALPLHIWFKKLAWIIIGPLLAWGAYKTGEQSVLSETFTHTDQVAADYTADAAGLIKEFLTNDSAANKKYLEKTIIVNGSTSVIEILGDSTSTIKFEDSTGSYAIFSLEKSQFDKINKITRGEAVSLKGVCSGSIYSEILGTTAITFKRATFNIK